MPTSEYYDRGLPEHKLTPANRVLQDEYWRLRSELCRAVATNMLDVAAAHPEIAGALTELTTFLGSHPKKTFRVFRPEDLDIQQEAAGSGAPIFLR